MRFEISKSGVLTLITENSMEDFAMQNWKAMNYISQKNDLRNEDGHYKGSSLQVVPLAFWQMQGQRM